MTKPTPPFRRLFVSVALAAAAGLAAVIVCYFWIDRPVAYFVDRHHLNQVDVFRWLTYPPPVVQSWSPAVITAILILWAWRPRRRWQQALLTASVSLILADACRTSLGDVCGRYWPETWFDNNPSLIGSGTYGFRPFAHGDDVGSFPSGHAARVLGFAGVLWIALPGSRAVWLLICPPLLASLVAMNYHFVGDVIAGSVLGGVVAVYAAQLAGLAPPAENRPAA